MRLNFDGANLTETPAIVFETPNLIELSVYNNKIKSIPERLFTQHPKLEVLNYAGNEIEEVPEGITNLQSIKMLDLRWNQDLKIGCWLDELEKKGWRD
ncbi:hypothetical protein BRE01_28810 [Brevibacillus reuszeri]|uniref:Uncharacterized protein n=1 Tax=Brevibacillus reuszeri TaxID=54915 RepID=A0A0K9YIZ7_9BACL|nr:leucine-rich repeat domain-containing protein [Brevibacillus reuszeri]KNB68673.1 hypothetical protein ADS79_32410 [Brevibacillus reuszeri]MED1858963.1 leucine-rich repeat domain-containing protein [Brevibacillus reuszeri]GED69179.1 hypothetical protein BRE01_28810 [Brevibacillus reuszeri]